MRLEEDGDDSNESVAPQGSTETADAINNGAASPFLPSTTRDVKFATAHIECKMRVNAATVKASNWMRI